MIDLATESTVLAQVKQKKVIYYSRKNTQIVYESAKAESNFLLNYPDLIDTSEYDNFTRESSFDAFQFEQRRSEQLQFFYNFGEIQGGNTKIYFYTYKDANGGRQETNTLYLLLPFSDWLIDFNEKLLCEKIELIENITGLRCSPYVVSDIDFSPTHNLNCGIFSSCKLTLRAKDGNDKTNKTISVLAAEINEVLGPCYINIYKSIADQKNKYLLVAPSTKLNYVDNISYTKKQIQKLCLYFQTTLRIENVFGTVKMIANKTGEIYYDKKSYNIFSIKYNPKTNQISSNGNVLISDKDMSFEALVEYEDRNNMVKNIFNNDIKDFSLNESASDLFGGQYDHWVGPQYMQSSDCSIRAYTLRQNIDWIGKDNYNYASPILIKIPDYLNITN